MQHVTLFSVTSFRNMTYCNKVWYNKWCNNTTINKWCNDATRPLASHPSTRPKEGWKLVWTGMNCAGEWLDECQNICWTTIHSPAPTFISLNYHILNLKGLFICSRPGIKDYHIDLAKHPCSMGWALVIVHPCRSNSRDRDRVYWQANYQFIVHSQPPVLVGVLISIYLCNCQGVPPCAYCNGCRYFHGKWKQVAVTYISWPY